MLQLRYCGKTHSTVEILWRGTYQNRNIAVDIYYKYWNNKYCGRLITAIGILCYTPYWNSKYCGRLHTTIGIFVYNKYYNRNFFVDRKVQNKYYCIPNARIIKKKKKHCGKPHTLIAPQFSLENFYWKIPKMT